MSEVERPQPPAGLSPALAARDGHEVTVTGRFEMTDLGRHRVPGPDGPTSWLCSIELDDGGALRLGGRRDGERLALVGRAVTARGRLVLAPGRAPPHVAQPDPAPTLLEPRLAARGELPLYDPVPVGTRGARDVVEVLVTYLEMHAPPAAELAAAPAGVRVERAAPPGVRFYRYLYDAVGAPWHWYDRKRWSDDAIHETVDDPAVEIHVLWRRGVPVGYVELDRRAAGACEVAYFGLVPEAIGGGLGAWFLGWSVRAAWRDPGLARLWVHTCTLDHPRALPAYRGAGFHPYRHERHRQYVVRERERAVSATATAAATAAATAETAATATTATATTATDR